MNILSIFKYGGLSMVQDVQVEFASKSFLHFLMMMWLINRNNITMPKRLKKTCEHGSRSS